MNRLWVAGAVVALAEGAVWVGVQARFALPDDPGLTEAEARQTMRALRGQAGGALPDRQAWATLYRDGESVVRRYGRLRELGVIAEPGRLKLDVEVGRTPVFAGWPLALAFSFVPGLDGVGLESGDQEVVLLPDDLVRLGLFGAVAPLPGEVRVGVDTQRAGERLRADLGAGGATGGDAGARARWFRVRTQGFVEGADGSIHAERRTLASTPPLDRAAVREAAMLAARYALASVTRGGRFRYLYDPFSGRERKSQYSLPRHAGTAWFLASVFRATGDPAFRKGAETALGYLASRLKRDGDVAYLGGGARPSIGSAALAAVALAEYREATGDGRFDEPARGLLRLIRAMQKPNGDFAHIWDTRAHRPDPREKLLYFSGEAAYALARLARIWPDADTDRALARALDWLTLGEYDYLMGQFLIGEDHWTCYAIEAAWPRLQRAEWARFCGSFVAFHRRFQFQPDEAGGEDFAGSYGVTPFVAPHTTPAASRSEAALACYALVRKMGREDPVLRSQIRSAMEFLVKNQIGPANDYLMRDPQRARGALRESAVSNDIRIDYVQHAGMALLRAAELVY